MELNKKVKCPHCKTDQFVSFDFGYEPDDGDNATEYIDCKCGCEFEVMAKIDIEVDCRVYEPEITKTPSGPVEEYQETYVSNDPNQLSLL